MREKFSPYLKKPTCIVLDNADYHMEMESGVLKIAHTKKQELQAWLIANEKAIKKVLKELACGSLVEILKEN